MHLVDGLHNDLAHKDKVLLNFVHFNALTIYVLTNQIHSMLKMKGDYFELIGTSGCVLATVCSDIYTANVTTSIHRL